MINKRYIDLIAYGSKNDLSLKQFINYSPVIITSADGVDEFVGLKQPGLNAEIIRANDVTDIQSLRQEHSIDDESIDNNLRVVNLNWYLRNHVDESEIASIDVMQELDGLTAQSHSMTFLERAGGFTEPVVMINDKSFTYSDIIQIVEVGENQRGFAEGAMLQYQKDAGGGVFGNAMEHIGDLIHRCTHMLKYGNSGMSEVEPKVVRMINSLESNYPFLQEDAENIENNHRFKTEHYDDMRTLEEFKSDLKGLRDEYAMHHMNLPSYNKLHLACKRAAVSLANQDIPVALMSLKQIEKMIGTNYEDVAVSYKKDPSDKLIDITMSDKYLLKFTDKEKRPEKALSLEV